MVGKTGPRQLFPFATAGNYNVELRVKYMIDKYESFYNRTQLKKSTVKTFLSCLSLYEDLEQSPIQST